jgi:hypothetical protein
MFACDGRLRREFERIQSIDRTLCSCERLGFLVLQFDLHGHAGFNVDGGFSPSFEQHRVQERTEISDACVALFGGSFFKFGVVGKTKLHD